MSTSRKIRELKKRRKYLGIIFICFFLIHLTLSPLFFMYFESSETPAFGNYPTAFVYNFQTMINSELSDYTIITIEGKTVQGILSFFYLIFIGFIGIIITISVQIAVLRKNYPM